MTGRRSPLAGVVATGGLSFVLLAGCAGGSGSPTSTATPSALATGTVLGSDTTVGALQIKAARIPQPASPDVAAAYLTIINTGDSPDALIGASTPAAASVTLHETTESSGVEQMVPLTSVPIPAHGTVAMTVGQRHLMLMNPPAALRAGDTVTLTLKFRRAGSVQVAVPVVPLTGFGASPTASPDMTDTPGMG